MKFLINSIGRKIPTSVNGKNITPFQGAFADPRKGSVATRPFTRTTSPSRRNKVVQGWNALLDHLPLQDGMSISFHHHLHNGDKIINEILPRLAERGLKDLILAPSELFPVHDPMAKYLETGLISRVEGSMNGEFGEACSRGKMKTTAVIRSHGGRYRAIQDADLPIDVAFIAAPTADAMGNATGLKGPCACGPMLYALPDALYAKFVVIITDNLVPYPCIPWSIQGGNVDFVLMVDSIGRPEKIVPGTTRLTKSPTQLIIAGYAAQFIEEAGIMQNGFSFQAGAGGISLAATYFLSQRMRAAGVKASFAHGGVTQVLVDLLQENLVDYLIDLESFDLAAIESCRENPRHVESTPFTSYNQHAKGCLADMLDVSIMGATEFDLDFNVNVNTHSDGLLQHGTGGHSDSCAGAACTIITAPSFRKRMPMIKEHVTTVTTPGEVVDVIITERGIAINPRREDLLDRLSKSSLPLITMPKLIDTVHDITGIPDKPKFSERPVAVVEWRDGTMIDSIWEVLS